MMKNSKNKTVALVLAAIGVIFYSTKAVFVKMAYVYGIDPVSLMTYRLLFSMPFYIVVWSIHNIKNKDEPKANLKEVLLIVFLGVIGYYFSSLLDFIGLQYLDASLERLILFIYPTIVLILSRIFLKKRITRDQLLAIGLTYIGVFVIFSQNIFDRAESENVLLGAGLIFLCAFTYATYLVGSNSLLPKLGTVNFTTYVMVVSFLTVLIHYCIEFGFTFKSYASEVYVISFFMAFISTVLPSYMIAEAIKRMGANTVGIMGSLGPVSTISLSIIFLGESLTVVQYIGAMIILGGIFMISVRKG
jgi:drug/metabolite transporter (DMT)-like permease